MNLSNPNPVTPMPTSLREMPLVAAQSGIWMADQLSPHHNAFAVAHYVELQGPLDSALLMQAIVAGLAEVDTLHMQVAERDGQAVQWFDLSQPLAAPTCADLRSETDPVATAMAWMRADLQGDLRVASGGLACMNHLMHVGEGRWFWYQRYHHLAVDGYSFAAITRRIAERYTALRRGEEVGPSPFTPFSRVVEEYQAYQQGAVCARDAQFWQDKARQLPPPVTLSSAPLGGQAASSRVLRHTLKLEAQGFDRLMAAQTGTVSRADMALALVNLWLSRLSGQSAFTAGFIFMRRMGSAAASTSGAVINVLPMHVQVAPEATLDELAQGIAVELKRLRKHQRYDAEQIQRDLGRLGDAEPLYGTVLNLKLFEFALDLDGIAGVTHTLASGPVRDLEVALFLNDRGEVSLELLANSERYDDATLARHLCRLTLLLQQFAANPHLSCEAASLLDSDDLALLERVNATAHPLTDDTLVSLMAAQALRTPHAPALSDAHYRFDYQQVREQVQALAQHLVAQGVVPGDIVAVALPRSVFLSLALMAILEVGAAYLPLDSGYPDDRLQLMLEDAQPRLIITERSQAARFPASCPTLLLEAPLALDPTGPLQFAGPSPEHAAYIIYTSGSTGRPKGVVVGHEAIVNRLLWMQHQYPLGADDVVLQKTPCSFDVSVWEFFWPLITGARLHMAPPEAHRDPEALQRLFSEQGVTTTHFVPSMLAAFVSALNDDAAIAHCHSLRQVFCSGEALPTDLSQLWQRRTGVPLHNLYGPTEAAVDVSWYPAHGEALAGVEGASVPIGFPVWNTGLRILDRRLRMTPPGVAGDLYLTGVQLAHAYLGRPDLTASRFIADPYGNGGRMYRTGDVARWLDNGAVEYLGRSDDQLKIRGQRIELSEIDHALLALPGVEQAVTHARVLGEAQVGGGDARQLVGYVIAQQGRELDLAALRLALADRLPAHMVPVALVQLDSFPLGATGKLDRKALPLPQVSTRSQGRAPQPGLESHIAEAFGVVLEREGVTAEDDFFALGGHSLLAMSLAATLRRELQRPVSVGQVMIASTVERLAALLASEQSEDASRRAGFETVLPLRQGNGPTLFCFHPASGFAWQFSVLQRYLDPHWSLVGIQSPRLGGPLQACEHLDAACDAHLRTVRELQPHGPYHFAGYSLGGTLAQGVAARLQAAGEEVAFLGLLDTYPPETQSWDERQGRNVLKQEVLDEVNRERELFLAAQQGLQDAAMAAGGGDMFDDIEANYADSVRLLATARSSAFKGEATLFVAENTLPEGMDVRQTWGPFVGSLNVHRLPCAHVDIISPASMAQVGPLINRALKGL
ncbi:enterobactin synthase subunit F [Pseudomonas eucalypticola]|uniref:Enterobactin synthase subunit F n=1 Tax=Pseudomonas eucalypticola TaxID=2599595 RepID=A0A7D5D6H4_9PSED|nr:enterobactin synthase subunit F [Pseudomonas eucalypticola]QKZ04559.1 enterobactin synthase subunit F [Pseudomonas eucalypticola]